MNGPQYFPGFKNKDNGLLLKKLFQADYFRIVVCGDEDTVELCGALKVTLSNSDHSLEPENSHIHSTNNFLKGDSLPFV